MKEERAKRIEEIVQNRTDRQNKRRQQRKMQTDQFLKSMIMLQGNCKPDHSEPFEDYSIFVYRQTAPNFEDRVKDLEKKFTYIPDRENRVRAQIKGETDEDFKARIKGMEDKCYEMVQTDKKPKDLMRAIGKIDNTDWNIKEIEKKIIENKLGKNVNKDKEKVPKWSREQFLARQTKMEKQHLERQDSTGGKFAEIDKNIRQLDQKLKEGTIREIKQQKVAKITEKLLPKGETEAKPAQKNVQNTKNVVISTQGNSKICHFCLKCVYLVERLSAEGKFFHRGCFRCQYCHTSLRLGSYLFDREGKYGFRFYCSQHFGMPGELKISKVTKKTSDDSDKRLLSGVAGVDLLDRVQTPERIEFSNLSTGNASSDHEESLSQMDEDEWTDRNFGASAAELGSTDDESSSLSGNDSDNEEAYEDALEEPPTKEGTLKLVEKLNKKYSSTLNYSSDEDYGSSDDNYYSSSGEDETDTATEGEEEIQARELRKQEVRVEPPVVHTDTGTDTEIASDDDTSSESSSEVQNSATEISTDSEFAQDDPTPTRETPLICFNDRFVAKYRGQYMSAKKVQVKSTEIQKSINPKSQDKVVPLKITTPVVQTVRKIPPPLKLNLTEGYALNRTQSTGGIASKVSLELKKKYLLGETNNANSIQKSGSASTLDSKFKSFHSTISDCQKLLKPAAEVSPGMQTFCNKLNERASPLSPLLISTTLQNKEFPKVDLQEKTTKIEDTPEPFQNETEGRPRSPVHETSIIVPQIDWSQKKQINNSTNSSESSSSSSSSDSDVNLPKSPSIKAFQHTPPKVEIQENLPPDSLNYNKKDIEDSTKSISNEKKTLNQPKPLPTFGNDSLLNQVHSVLHSKINKPEDNDKNSGRSTPSNNSSHDQITNALTETELSDWARDGIVSDDYEDEDFDLNSEKEVDKMNESSLARKLKDSKKTVPIDVKNMHHVCSKTEENDRSTEYVSNILNPNLDNIEFMDTGSEASDDDVVEVKNNGYVQFHDEDDILDEDSLSPVINVYEAKNPKIKATFDEDPDDLSTVTRNTGYCVFEPSQNGKDSFGGEVIDLKPADLEKLKEKRNLYENEEDSLLIIEAGTTTEENTCSDSTVKNITQVIPSKEKETKIDFQENNNMLDKKRLEDKLAQVKKDMKKLSEQRKAEHLEEQNLRNNIEFDQHCQRLQSKVDFNNAKDSIDIRKSRKQSKTESPPKPDLIQEEKEISPIRSRKEQLEIERDFNQKVIQEMVMNKMKAQNKSLERKKRNRNPFSPSISPSRPYEINRSQTTQLNSPTPDVILTTMPLQKSQTGIDLHNTNEPKPMPRTKYNSGDKFSARPLSVHSSFLRNSSDKNKSPIYKLTTIDAFSLPDINKVTLNDDFKTPKAPPRTRNEETMRTVEKLKEDARARARLLSDEDLGLSPEDKLARLRQRVNQRGKENHSDMSSFVLHAEKQNPLIYANDTLSKKRNNAVRRSKSGEDYIHLTRVERTKSIPEIQNLQRNIQAEKKVEKQKFFKSDPNLLLDAEGKKEKKKTKDRERRKSITKLITDLFTKKKDSNQVINLGNKSFLSRISPRGKDKSKELIKEEPVRRMSLSENRKPIPGNVSPPPIPPLPVNYTGTNSIEYNSDHEFDWKQTDRSSCDTLDQSGLQDGSHCSRRSNRSARKMARQSQLKRHRTAQEIQRKLEEVEVKTRELEQRGVHLEKAVRGEITGRVPDEPELLREWFDLMKEMNELRRFETELTIRAKELELEDRHSRLQQELKERLDNDGKKTQEDFETEGSIINEMMEIVAKRDSLSKKLKDLLRYSQDDKEFEEQMLAKGIGSEI